MINERHESEESTSRIPQFHPYPPPYLYGPPPYVEEDEINLLDLWRVLVKQKWLIFAVVFISTLTATIIALVSTPIYRAETLLAPVDSDGTSRGGLGALAGQFGGLADLAGISMPSNGNVETAIATLKSRKFITRFIAGHNLKPILFHESWNSETSSWMVEEPSLLAKVKAKLIPSTKPESTEQLLAGEPSAWDAYKLFSSEILNVSQDSKTGLITVTVEWEDPRRAAVWANGLVERLNTELRQRAIDEAERSIAYLKEQVASTSVADLRTVLFRLIEEHAKNITLAKVNDEYALKVIDPAMAPEERVKPRRSFMVILGFVLGIMLGIFIAFIRNMVMQSKETKQSS